MNYQVLYRQLRPNTFSDMVGQETVIKTLKNQIITAKIPHAYLFCGSRGTGKTSAAKILAKAVNCLSPVGGDPCGQCKNCVELAAETSLDIIEMDAASNNGVDEIRDLREQVKYPPQVGRYKVYIIDEVHMLTMAAFNALLKTLEEPPEHAIFILATTEPQKLPATIISRCQRFEFKRISAGHIAQYLTKVLEDMGRQFTPKALNRIARSAEGGLRDALGILDMCLGTGEVVDESLVQQILGTSDTAFMFAFAKSILDQKTNQALQLVDQLLRDGKEAQVFAKDASYHFRALLLAKTAEKEIADILEITKEDAQEYARQANKVSVERLLYITDIFMEIESQLRYASSGRILLETATIKAALSKETHFSATVEGRIAALEDLCSQLTKGEIVIAQSRENGPREPFNPSAVTIASPPPSPLSLGQGEALEAQEAQAPATTGKSGHSSSPASQQLKSKEKNSTTADLNNPGDIWKQVMRQLQKTQAGIFGQLREGTFSGIKSNRVQITFDQGNVFMVNYLNNESRKKAIMECIQQVSGQDLGFEAAVKQEKEASKQKEGSLLEGLFQDFGRENIQIDEND